VIADENESMTKEEFAVRAENKAEEIPIDVCEDITIEPVPL
jgi:hypothetical protein